MEILPDFGVPVSVLPLPGSYPNPTAADVAKTRRLLKTKSADAVLVVDGLAFGAFPENILDELEGRVIALVHHPLFLETGLPHARKVELKEREKEPFSEPTMSS